MFPTNRLAAAMAAIGGLTAPPIAPRDSAAPDFPCFSPNSFRKISGRSSILEFRCLKTMRMQAVNSGRLAPASKAHPSSEVLDIWRRASAVCFDVDSTVCVDEGIDELANFCGAGEAVAAWTTRAMGGSVSFQEALAARLALFQPSHAVLQDFLNTHPPRLNLGIGELINKLHARGTSVYLVSGGFRQMIEPTAALLNIPKANIFANRLVFKENGDFAGFDETEPTSKSGGKAVAVSQIKKKNGYKNLVMVGDGATDLEARMPGGADIFICYTGVELRPNVAAASDWCISRFSELVQVLD